MKALIVIGWAIVAILIPAIALGLWWIALHLRRSDPPWRSMNSKVSK